MIHPPLKIGLCVWYAKIGHTIIAQVGVRAVVLFVIFVRRSRLTAIAPPAVRNYPLPTGEIRTPRVLFFEEKKSFLI